MYETLIRMYYFFAMSFSRSLQSGAYAVWGLYFSHAAYCPFHMVEGLDVAMRGAGGRVGEGCRGGLGEGRGRDSLCCNMLLWW